jgi:hypothetical protein
MHGIYVKKIKVVFMIIKIYFDTVFSEGRFKIFPLQDSFRALHCTRLIYQFWGQSWQTREFVQEF